MATVQHPAFDHVRNTVPDGDVTDWTDSGWIVVDDVPETERDDLKSPDGIVHTETDVQHEDV